MITGTTRPFSESLRQVRWVIDGENCATPFGVHVVSARGRTVMIADTAVTERPTAEQYAAIAMRAASFARRMEEWGTIQAVERLNLDGLLALWHPR